MVCPAGVILVSCWDDRVQAGNKVYEKAAHFVLNRRAIPVNFRGQHGKCKVFSSCRTWRTSTPKWPW